MRPSPSAAALSKHSSLASLRLEDGVPLPSDQYSNHVINMFSAVTTPVIPNSAKNRAFIAYGPSKFRALFSRTPGQQASESIKIALDQKALEARRVEKIRSSKGLDYYSSEPRELYEQQARKESSYQVPKFLLQDSGVSASLTTGSHIQIPPDERSICILDDLVRSKSFPDIYDHGNFVGANCCISPMILQLVRDVISEVVILHRWGIVHGDINPDNIFILKGQRLFAKLVDVAESIVKTEILKTYLTDVSAAPAFVRLLFHDCQVQACDASILLYSHESTCKSEMESSRNFGVKRLEVINHIKSILEITCPGQVSCADIIALAAKESVFITGGPKIKIPFGRKDSVTCSSSQLADTKLPAAGIAVDELLRISKSFGMNLEESVAIIGAHTLGIGHCINIVDRLYNEKLSNQMNWSFKALLRLTCPTKVPLTNLTFVPNDSTSLAFDNQYYKDILMGKGSFGIDASISRDPRTKPVVRRFAADQSYFFHVFSSAFVKLSSTRVLTDKEGEVRRQCYRIN
ncbi:Peroxidase 29 [Morus notabilis]|uniref:peroxidase n=1 Tax=Morus notabilis TaxID=981085 RepID=W9RJV4_9ROSA|nr:Peroxidase 29 [Morus notabilis]